jgi:tryptophan-rich sensory protein
MHPGWAALLICLTAAALEGLAAGPGVRDRLRSLRQPAWAPPFPAWVAIGGFYYVACGFIAYRLLLLGWTRPGVTGALALLGLVLVGNAAWNLAFFRRRDLRRSAQISIVYAVLALALGAALLRVDRTSGWPWLAYLAYLIYGTCWVLAVRRLNAGAPAA